MSEFSSGELFERIHVGVQLGAARALAKHKREGILIAVMKDGKVIRIAPEDIVVPEVIIPDFENKYRSKTI